jgi:radical SAM superfamily enzyme YgiQ (UPF0313 family)
LEYVAAALRPYAEKIELINFRHQRKPGTLPFLRPETDLVCYSINWRMNLTLIRDDINALPPGVTVILGGRTATEDPRYWLDACPNVAAVVCGDGEQAMAEIGRQRPWSEVAGLVHRGSDGQLVFNPPRANVPMDDDLMPARDLRRGPYYLTSKRVSTGIKIDLIAGSRGCPYNCKFCNFAINPWGVKRCWTPRSPASIVREIEQIDADLILFVDDVFTHQPDRVAEICDLMIAKGIRKYFIVNARSEIASRPDVLRKMEQAGCIALLIGIESTQDATLKSIGKGFNIQQVRQRFGVLRQSKMILNAYFIVGNLGETEEQMLSTVPLARSMGVDLILVSPLRNEPYSGLAELVQATPGYHIDADGMVYSDRYSADHIADLRKRIYSCFYSPLHVARVIFKLVRVLDWRVKAKAALTLPAFLTMLVAKEVQRKLLKWIRNRRAGQACNASAGPANSPVLGGAAAAGAGLTGHNAGPHRRPVSAQRASGPTRPGSEF